MKALRKRQKQFILGTLLPYKVNSYSCAYDEVNDICIYLTQDGRKCAVGKHMKVGAWQNEQQSFENLLKKYDKKNFLKKRALDINLPNSVWQAMQNYHDELATHYLAENHRETEEVHELALSKAVKDMEISLAIDLKELR